MREGRERRGDPLDQVASWPATAAVGVASAAGLMEKVGPADRLFGWASVTKLLVALAALDAVQHGLLDLDEPAGPPGSTIRHLLAHASGLAFDSDTILSRPGTRRIYSNRGIEIVADLVAARYGQPFERLLADEICLPLGMAATRLEGSPAWGAVGPLSDLMKLAVELASPSLVEEDLMAEATRTAFPGLSGVLPGFAVSCIATGAWASRSRTARRRTGPDRGTRRGRSVISGARAASSGWIPRPGWSARPWPTVTSTTGPSRRGRGCPTICSCRTPETGFPGAAAGMLMSGTDTAERRCSVAGGRARCPGRFRSARFITCGSR